jgi:hypothetical protein
MLVEGHQAAVSSAQHCHLGKGTKVIYDTLAAAVAPMTAPQWNLKQQNSRSVVPLSAHTSVCQALGFIPNTRKSKK